MNYASHAPTNEFLNNINNMFSSGFRPLITCPTRLTGHSSTLIDNIFSNALSYKENSGILYADVSDHLPIFVILDSKIKLLPKPKLVSYRTKREQAPINFHTFIENETWDDVLGRCPVLTIIISLLRRLNQVDSKQSINSGSLFPCSSPAKRTTNYIKTI